MKSPKQAFATLAAIAASSNASASTDYSSIIIAFSVGDIISALMSVGAILAGLFAVRTGLFMIIRSIKGQPLIRKKYKSDDSNEYIEY